MKPAVIVVYLTSSCVIWAFFGTAWASLKLACHASFKLAHAVPKKAQITQERVEYNGFLFDEPPKAPNR
jgi:hypothetical protein